MRQASPITSAQVRSHVVLVITCGTTVTGIPRRVAASTSTTLGNSAMVAMPFKFSLAEITSSSIGVSPSIQM